MIDRRAAGVAIAGLLGCVVGLFLAPRDAFAAWLVCWLAWGSIPIGALAGTMILALVPGSWRDLYDGPLALATALLPLTAVLALPLLAGIGWIYPWADPAVASTLGGFKGEWLSVAAFVIRELIILAALSGLAWGMAMTNRLPKSALAGGGLLIYALAASIIGIDFGESTEPHFHSSIYGLLALTSQWLAAASFGILLGLAGKDRAPFAAAGLLATTILLWAYMHAMQYIVIWSANIPEEAHWYIERGGAWRGVGWAGFALQAILPFIALLSPAVRNSSGWMRAVSALILVAAPLQQAWMILPGLKQVGWAALPLILASSMVMLGLGWAAAGALSGRLAIHRRFGLTAQ